MPGRGPPIGPTELELQDLFVREGARLRRYMATLVGARDAPDLVQEAFVRARRARAECATTAVGAWVRQIARNVAIDHLRRSTSTVLPGSGDIADVAAASIRATDPDPERTAITREMHDCIGEFVRRLPARDAEVIVLSELRGLADQEVATELGITLGAAKIRLHRARARLRDLMQRGCELYHDEGALACDRKA